MLKEAPPNQMGLKATPLFFVENNFVPHDAKFDHVSVEGNTIEVFFDHPNVTGLLPPARIICEHRFEQADVLPEIPDGGIREQSPAVGDVGGVEEESVQGSDRDPD